MPSPAPAGRPLLSARPAPAASSVFAIDVSSATAVNPTNVLWEWNSVTDPDLGYSMGKPLILPLENGSWGAVFSNGYGGDPAIRCSMSSMSSVAR